MAIKLDQDALTEALKALSGWKATFDGAAIHKTFSFANFRKGFAFAAEIALLAEGMNHHPDLTIEYKAVMVRLTTHDKGGVTDKDIKLAQLIEKI